MPKGMGYSKSAMKKHAGKMSVGKSGGKPTSRARINKKASSRSLGSGGKGTKKSSSRY